ncbi:MAG: serine/threonine protein kinase [Thermoproteota archaeon]|jgi:serine/threonine protein kinase
MKNIADYVVRERLREGNHGTVFLAEPPSRLGVEAEIVAIKTLRQHADPDDFRRVANELRLLNSVDSPHVVRLLDAGSDSGRLFFVMPYYVSGSLEVAATTLTRDQLRRCVSDAARGADALHAQGIAHRDIKPANVFVENERGVLGELGLAELVGGGSTTVGAGPLGALEFTAPEIIWGHPASRQTDIWSLAMTLHRVLTGSGALGQIPKAGILDACRHVLHTRPEIDASLDPATRQLLERCFNPDPESRHLTAEEFADDVDQTIEGSRNG